MTVRHLHRVTLLIVFSFMAALANIGLSSRRIMIWTNHLLSSDIPFHVVDDNRLDAHTHAEHLTSSATEYPVKPVQVTPFETWTNKWGTNHSPCVVDPRYEGNPFNIKVQKLPSNQGILYIKIDKAASSTIAGVAARIAHALARDKYSTTQWNNANTTSGANVNNDLSTQPKEVTSYVGPPVCRVRLSHIWSKRTKKLSDRIRNKSFLFTFIKNPSRRALSDFYFFTVDRPLNQTVPPDHVIIEDLKTRRLNYQLRKISDNVPKPVFLTNSTLYMDMPDYKQRMAKRVNSSLRHMDFVGVVERMDESLVLLQLLLNLKTSDVLFAASAKQSGSWQSGEWRGEESCYYVSKHTPPLAVQNFLASQEWKLMNYGDELLYQVVNARLDATIDAIGRTVFERALQNFRDAKAKVEKNCPSPTLACDANGTFVPKQHRAKCYWGDAGCGYECLDKIFRGHDVGASNDPFETLVLEKP